MAHNERCRACKKTVQAMLEKIYGRVEPNYQIGLGTRPEDYAGEAVYPALSRVYDALQEHRGYGDFVRAERIAADFFVPEPGFVVEFDESQHFTKPRLIALENYPAAMQAGYSVPRWKELCASLDRRDNDPPYRDEQRAWYDTLRDFLPEIKGYLPTVRLYSREMVWCELDPEKPGDVERFGDLLAQKRGSPDNVQAGELGNENKADNWIVTVTLRSDRAALEEKDPKYNGVRINELKLIISEILAQTRGDGVILFPGGWVHTGFEPAESIYPVLEGEIKQVLSMTDRDVIACVGVDGKYDRPLEDDPYDQDQIAVAVSKSGIIAAGRKFYPTNEEERKHITLADSYLARQNGFPRTFDLNGTRYFLFVCYDIYGPRSDPDRYSNPGVDIGLNLIHRFCPKGEGPSQENYFPRYGFAGASKIWGIPIFGTGIYYRRDIPADWPTGVYWKPGGRVRCTYEEIALPVDRSIGPISVPEGHVEVRVFSDIRRNLNSMQVPAPARVEKGPQVAVQKSARPRVQPGRDAFANVVTAFEAKSRFPRGLQRKFAGRDQCRYSFPAWQRINDKPIKYVCYEFNDWIGHGKPEISVEVLFGLEAFRDIAEIIHARAPAVQERLPHAAELNWKTSTRGWLRLQYSFPDTVEPGLIADSMAVLVEETRETVNNWLKERGMSHY